MFDSLPRDPRDFISWTWADYEPYYRQLEARAVTARTLDDFVSDWSALAERVDEALGWLRVAADRDVSDVAAQERYRTFVSDVVMRAEIADGVLRARMCSEDLSDHGMDLAPQPSQIPNGSGSHLLTPLTMEEWDTQRAHTILLAQQDVIWEGARIPIRRLQRAQESPDRRLREKAWRLGTERRLLDAPAIDDLWQRVVRVRREVATRAGVEFSECCVRPSAHPPLTPDEARRFRDAVEEFVTSVLVRIHERRRGALGVKTFRPWDLDADPHRRAPPSAPETERDLVDAAAAGLGQVDRPLAEDVTSWHARGDLRLESGSRKVPWGYCGYLPVSQVPYIVQNPSGSARDIEELLHLCGVAAFLAGGTTPYPLRRHPSPEAVEAIGVATELRVLHGESGGAEAVHGGIEIARARMGHLERCLLRWAFAAMLDAFERDAYRGGADSARSGERWCGLWLRFLPSIDVTDLEYLMANEWQRHSGLFLRPMQAAPRAIGQLMTWRAWIDGDEEGVSRAMAEAVEGRASFDANDLHDVARWIEDAIEDLERAVD